MKTLLEIHEKAFQVEGVGKSKYRRIDEHDQIFLMGGLNFSLQLTKEKIREIVGLY